jgi:uncharacterized protein (TIGR02466 family)
MSQPEVLELFPAVVRTCRLEDDSGLRQRVRDLILTAREEDPQGLEKSNLGGYHSGRLRGEPISALESAVLSHARDYARQMAWDLLQHQLELTEEGFWAVVNGKGAANALHIHQRSQLSGVYYVAAPRGSGDLIFEAPRPPHVAGEPVLLHQTMTNARRMAAIPRDGLLVLFPSWLPHRVAANHTDEERIAVSFNLVLAPIGGAS